MSDMRKVFCVLLFISFVCGMIQVERRVGNLQRRSLEDNRKSTSVELDGSASFGLYYISLSVGNPPQHFTVQCTTFYYLFLCFLCLNFIFFFVFEVDTGSSDFAIPMLTCPQSQCGQHEDAYYDPSLSENAMDISKIHYFSF